MRVFSVFVALFLLLTLPAQVGTAAQDIIQSCERAQSTADIMRCVKKRHDEAQKRLNKIFDQLLVNESARAIEHSDGVAPAEIPSTLRITHQNWITYRDYQCAWETSLEPAESLKRIRELSCLTALTEQRGNILGLALDREIPSGKSGAQYSSTPRWMNALGADKPNIFWRYHDHIRADLDCDGEEEEIMAGLSAALRDTRTKETDKYLVKSVVAITENPATGRPKSTFFESTVFPEEQEGQLCRSNVKLSIVDMPLLEGAEDVKPKACGIALKIDDGKCTPHIVRWTGATYEYMVRPAAQ